MPRFVFICTMPNPKLFLLIIFTTIICWHKSFAQKSNYNWLFGTRAAISFESGNAQVSYKNPINMLSSSASISNPNTGELIFYTDGKAIWNKNNNLIGVINATAALLGDVLIMPYPHNNGKYFVFVVEFETLYYLTVDMNANGGQGAISIPREAIETNLSGQIALINHQYKNACWLVTHKKNSNLFYTYLIDSGGLTDTHNTAGIGSNAELLGEITTNNKGNKIAVSHYAGNNNIVEVFDFDAACGLISNHHVLPKQTNWDRSYGLAFSENDTKLYVSYSYLESHLVQYSGNNFQNYTLIATTPDNLNALRLGPDNKIYITTHESNIPSAKIDVINLPDLYGNLCQYSRNVLNLDDGTGRRSYFQLPDFTKGKTIINPINDGVVTLEGKCVNQTSTFTFSTLYPYDSINWEFEPGTNSNQVTAQYTYTKKGKFPFKLSIYRCGQSYVFVDSITVSQAPEINFPTDTFKCAVNSITLDGPSCDSYLWSNGSTLKTITVQNTGLIWLKVGNGDCFAYDSIDIKNHPDVITQLGSEYFLCEDEKEIIKLDAGEGFTAYKWTPTNDTTQWIMVKQVGDYFVKVTDNNGCIGNDDTKVKRKCGVTFYVPNIFTPNNDGNNDVFLPVGNDVVTYDLKIYNRWGQLVFTSNDVSFGWDGTIDGKAAAGDVYVYQITYQGYQNKVLKTFTQMGNVTLLN